MKKILIILLIVLSFGSNAQIKTITGTAKPGMAWSITGTGTNKNLNLSLTRSAVGLSFVQNTSDISKPLSSAAIRSLQAKSDSIKILFAKDVANKAEITLLKSTISILKTDIVALKKSDTLFFMGLPGAGTRLSPFNMTTILDDIELLKTKIPDYAFEKTITTTETKLSNRINALSKRIYRLEKNLKK